MTIETEVKRKAKSGPKHPKGGFETSIMKPGFRPCLPEESATNQQKQAQEA